MPVVSSTTWVRKSPKKPPVMAPIMKVLTPHSPIRENRCPMVPLGRYFRVTSSEARIIKAVAHVRHHDAVEQNEERRHQRIGSHIVVGGQRVHLRHHIQRLGEPVVFSCTGTLLISSSAGSDASQAQPSLSAGRPPGSASPPGPSPQRRGWCRRSAAARHWNPWQPRQPVGRHRPAGRPGRPPPVRWRRWPPPAASGFPRSRRPAGPDSPSPFP